MILGGGGGSVPSRSSSSSLHDRMQTGSGAWLSGYFSGVRRSKRVTEVSGMLTTDVYESLSFTSFTSCGSATNIASPVRVGSDVVVRQTKPSDTVVWRVSRHPVLLWAGETATLTWIYKITLSSSKQITTVYLEKELDFSDPAFQLISRRQITSTIYAILDQSLPPPISYNAPATTTTTITFTTPTQTPTNITTTLTLMPNTNTIENWYYDRRGSAALTMLHPSIRKNWH
jgi:hypothetical protein